VSGVNGRAQLVSSSGFSFEGVEDVDVVVSMSHSPTRVEPSLKRTRFLWARRQFCFNSSRMASTAEQILRAGPSLIDMADMRWSALSSMRA